MTILEPPMEHDAHETAVNGELIEPITQVPSVPEQSATDVIIIDNDSRTDDIVISQECDSETDGTTHIKQEPVDSDVINTTMAADANAPDKTEVRKSIVNTSGQRRSDRGNLYTSTQKGQCSRILIVLT